MVLIALGAGLVVSGAPVVDPPSGDVYDDLDWLFVEYFFEPVYGAGRDRFRSIQKTLCADVLAIEVLIYPCLAVVVINFDCF